MQTIAVPLDQTGTETIAVYDRSHAAVLEATKRSGYPHRALTTRLASFLGTMLDADLNEMEMRQLADTIDAAIDDRWHPVTSLEAKRAVLRAESDADRAEDAISDLRLIETDCPVHMEEHANRLDRQSVTSRAASRVLRACVSAVRRARTHSPARA